MKCNPLIFLFLFLSLFSLGQQNAVLDLDSYLNIGNYTARDRVNLLPGTLARPLNAQNDFHFFIDKSIQLNSSYENSVNFIDPPQTIDQSKSVGAIKGQASVSLAGQSSYVIPINLPPGTNNFVPSLSIVYNSGLTDGNMGRGWNISGISAITRVPKDLYHDCVKKAIVLDESDQYALDGVRIIDHQLENDNFSYITKQGTGSSCSFKVETKEGLILEYGSSDDSKLMVTIPVANTLIPLVWYLNKISDRFGNNITYEYYNQNKEIALKVIKYTGNDAASITPYDSIKFYYDVRADKSLRYILNNPLPSTLILREIEVDCEGIRAHGYKFKYGFNSQSFLNEITEIGSNDAQLTSTYIKYGDNVTEPYSLSFTEPITTGNFQNIMKNADYRVGDFNGDGKSDLLAFEYNSIGQYSGEKNYTGKWKLYINTINSTINGWYFTEYD